MVKVNVLLSKTAAKELNSLDNMMQERVRASRKELESDPFQPRPKADIKKLHKMSKHQFYRLRIGSYRIMYAGKNADVKVTRIIARGNGYDWLE